MVRSMYSGVSGLRAHQTRMDTIGNNIANVNTYGYKSSRATFRDIYYQTLATAGGPTAAQGGTNPTQVGYGTQVGSIDLMMGRSTFSMTDQTMDLAIDGDGFFQVQDANGNIYYTRAGMLNFDSAGNLVDMQGNYVLGVNGDPTGRAPSSERITVALPNVQPQPGTATQTINGREYTISATNNTIDGNINFNFSSDATMTDGVLATAKLSSTGIIVTFNANETFSSWADVNNAINDAIIEANGGKEHVAGRFNVTYSGDASKDPFLPANLPQPAQSLTGAELASTDYGVQYGKVSMTNAVFGGISATGNVGSGFSGNGDITSMDCRYDTSSGVAKWIVTATLSDNSIYTGEIDASKTNTGKFNLTKGGDSSDYIEMNRPSFNAVTAAFDGTMPSNGTKAEYSLTLPSDDTDPALAAGTTLSLAGYSINTVAGHTTFGQDVQQLVDLINADATGLYNATYDTGSTPQKILLEAKNNGVQELPKFTFAGASIAEDVAGVNDFLVNGNSFAQATNLGTVTPSGPSYALGLSGTAITLRGGTEGGPQTIADMTGIAIAANGMIFGLDSQGNEVIIGRIDLATFPNQAGLTQAGSTTYMQSANSGVAQLTTPGTNGAGQLVGGTLELSNVDLSREFSDMITTQRGYQANSRIITVSDTMLEELINLKR